VNRVDKNRRRVLTALALLSLAGVTRAHTPYRQWVVYRRKHLLIGTTRADPDGYRLGKELAAVLVSELPESRARVARARDARRLASLMATGQLRVALLDTHGALAMAAGDPPFQDFGPQDLRVLLVMERRLLVAVAALPDRHAWLVTGTLLEAGFGDRDPGRSVELPLHRGSLAYVSGTDIPDSSPDTGG
jgi:hypothetical protein